MSFVNKKSFISVEWMLTIAIILILLIGLVIAFQIFFPVLGDVSDIQRQRNHINEVLDAIDDVWLTGEEQVIKFKVEEYTKCIWYNTTNPKKLEVEYETANESFLVPPIEWSGDGDIDIGNGGRPTCNEAHLVGPKTCDVYITINEVKVTC